MQSEAGRHLADPAGGQKPEGSPPADEGREQEAGGHGQGEIRTPEGPDQQWAQEGSGHGAQGAGSTSAEVMRTAYSGTFVRPLRVTVITLSILATAPMPSTTRPNTQ